MLSPSQERLIRWLGRFSRDLSLAWDVPREVSLPGLSEAMGVDCILLAGGHQSRSRLEASEARVVDELSEVIALLEKKL